MMIARNLLSILILPFTVTVLIPRALVPQGTVNSLAGQAVGVLLGVCGGILLATTIWHFATRGRGTLAPWDPPRHLVVAGVYRYVRNPMISGVLLVLVGESLYFASFPVAVLAIAFFALNATYIPLVEEKSLVRRFGAEYETYRRNVPRWVPRRSAWEAEGEHRALSGSPG